MEIKLTILGNREIPMEVSQELLDRLSDPNIDVELRVVVSAYRSERDLLETPPTEIRKVKIISIDPI